MSAATDYYAGLGFHPAQDVPDQYGPVPLGYRYGDPEERHLKPKEDGRRDGFPDTAGALPDG
ncbi:hypothetical protein [Nibribacter koreensis]|uniref:Uncharacterized protein n=1 Tax=Nibribacter koreensis TaxID=1084519 RepID=A0ABP8FB61_9BACT